MLDLYPIMHHYNNQHPLSTNLQSGPIKIYTGPFFFKYEQTSKICPITHSLHHINQ
jgi:hypothetical protein